MTRRLVDMSRAAELCRRHGAVVSLTAIVIGALALLAVLTVAGRRSDEAHISRNVVATAADAVHAILAEDRRLLDRVAAAAASDQPSAAVPVSLRDAQAIASFDPTGVLTGRSMGPLDDATLAALGAAALREATARPGATTLLTRAVRDPALDTAVIGLARPFFAADGAMGGVALVALDRSAFAALDRLRILSPGAHLDLLRADGAPLFDETDAPDSAGSRRADIADFPLALRYRPAVTESRRGLRDAALCLVLIAIAVAAALGLVAVIFLRQHHAIREVARLARLERKLRDDLAAAAATVNRSDQLSRTKSQFFAQVTHELRTPLNAILGFSETIRQEMFGPVVNPRYLEYAGLINDAGSHLLSLINDLLDNARIEAGKMDVAPIRVSAPALARSALDLVELLAEGRDIAIATSGLASCPDLNVDPRAMKQVLVNLLSNAIKYTTAGGRIALRFTARSDGGVAIEISDTGIGMTAEDAAHAFEPFGRAGGEKARRQQGTGLGLSLARALVRLHGGDLILKSRLGAGTTVTVLLPASAAFAGADPRLLPAARPDAAAA
jgi:signal transduction histidine kinase